MLRKHVGGWSFLDLLPWACALLALVVGSATHDRFFHRYDAPAPTVETNTPAAPDLVALNEGKLKVAGLESEPAKTEALPTRIDVPATIEVNVDRQAMIRPRVAGVVRSVAVRLGQVVKQGDLLVLLDSPEVGTARLNLISRQMELATARTEAEWKSVVARNVETLVPLLRQQVSTKTIETRFADKPLGSDRASLLAAYADLEIARHEEEKQVDLNRRQIVGEHPMFQAMHGREAAQAKFEANLEQVRYDSTQEKRIADQALKRAETAVIDAIQRLRILGAPNVGIDPASLDTSAARSQTEEDVTSYPITAPFDGTITTRSVVPSQRVELTDEMFTLVDLTTVRVAAHVPESEFTTLNEVRRQGGTVRFTAVAYPGRTFEARLFNVGAEVDPRTRTVRVLAEVPNPEGLLRPGMFARLALDGPAAEPALTVPTAAVIEVDGKSSVFVCRPDPGQFALRHVEPGRETAGRRVIVTGLREGDRVVSRGAFLLKSEMILQNEPEEE